MSLAALAACGGGSSAPATSSPSGPTVGQYATVIAGNEQQVQEAVATADHGCVILLADCINHDVQPVVNAVEPLSQGLGGLGGVVGAPVEIRDLVDSTLTKTAAVLSAAGRINGVECANLGPSKTCINRVSAFVVAGDDLVKWLRSWQPYL